MKKAIIFTVSAAALLAAATAKADIVLPDSVMFEDQTVAMSLTGMPGDPQKGRELFANRKLGNCLACHENSNLDEQPFHGEVGPSLNGVANRWEEPQLRAILVNSKMVFGNETIMPSFYRLKNGARTQEKFQGKTILTAEQVEDIIAYLKTLKTE